MSSAEGQLFLPNLRPDRYEVTSELSGFAPTKQQLAFWEMFNVFNAVNWLRYQGSLQSTSFGLALTEGPKRPSPARVPVDF